VLAHELSVAFVAAHAHSSDDNQRALVPLIHLEVIAHNQTRVQCAEIVDLDMELPGVSLSAPGLVCSPVLLLGGGGVGGEGGLNLVVPCIQECVDAHTIGQVA